ncbi:hypothetical protein K1719_032058 [Acacia pycnantha]|nr:hypothetical protein K1719_032058 [Acacia pycnantha]
MDSFKSNQNNILAIYGKLKGESNNGVRVVVSPEDRIEEGYHLPQEWETRFFLSELELAAKWMQSSKLLDILRGKRMMFIGDSLWRGQFESMIYLVQSVIPEGKKSLHRVPPMKIFKIEKYNASIEYYWAPS